jgi:hypothetical protein
MFPCLCACTITSICILVCLRLSKRSRRSSYWQVTQQFSATRYKIKWHNLQPSLFGLWKLPHKTPFQLTSKFQTLKKAEHSSFCWRSKVMQDMISTFIANYDGVSFSWLWCQNSFIQKVARSVCNMATLMILLKEKIRPYDHFCRRP